ncbi:MAG: alpha/beta hydrolase fold domain-containing protein [Bacillota bacterium]
MFDYKKVLLFSIILIFIFNYRTLALNKIIEIEHKNLLKADLEALMANILEFNFEEGKYIKDITYKSTENEDLTLDIFLPGNFNKNQDNRYPVIIYLHGGSFIRGGKKEILELKPLLKKFLNKGWGVVSVNYRLINKNNNFPDNIEDIFSTIQWVKENAKKYSFDSKKIGLIGHSAGGNLALMGGLASGDNFSDKSFEPADIKFIISMAGPTKLDDTENFKLRKNIISYLSEKDFDNKLLKNASPINYLHQDSPPVLLVHGTEDLFVPFKQSIDFYQKASELDIDCMFIKINNAGHTIRLSYLPVIEELGDYILDFIEKYGF